MAAAPAPLAAWYVLTTILETCRIDDHKIVINVFGQSTTKLLHDTYPSYYTSTIVNILQNTLTHTIQML
jgi:protein gp37